MTGRRERNSEIRADVAERLAALAERHRAEQDLATRLTIEFDRITTALTQAGTLIEKLARYGHTHTQIAELVGADPTLIRYATRTRPNHATDTPADS